jgi:hypothetical protein
VDQLAADHVVTVHEDDLLMLRGDLRKGRLLMHAKIFEAEPPLRIQVIEICLERDHDGVQRSSFGTGLGSGSPRNRIELLRGQTPAVMADVSKLRRRPACTSSIPT